METAIAVSTVSASPGPNALSSRVLATTSEAAAAATTRPAAAMIGANSAVASRAEPQADDQRDGEHGEQLDPLDVLPDELALVIFGRYGTGHPDHVVGRLAEVPVHVGVCARRLHSERGARPEDQERDDRSGLLVRPVQQPGRVGQRERPGQSGDPARRPRADLAAQDLGGVGLAGFRQRRCGLRERARGRPGQPLVHGDGLADRLVPDRRRHPVRVTLHDRHGRVDGKTEQPGRVAFRVGGG